MTSKLKTAAESRSSRKGSGGRQARSRALKICKAVRSSKLTSTGR